MLYKIADIITEIPAAGGLPSRCMEYVYEGSEKPQIIILDALYRHGLWPNLGQDDAVYMESGIQFYEQILQYNGIMLHASAIEWNDRAYLFSGPSGMGKSTHTRLWKQLYGESVRIFNDDKPVLRCIDNEWYAYGTPWCGKDHINQNRKVKVAGICFLKQDKMNEIRVLSHQEAVQKVISQTQWKFWKPEQLEKYWSCVESLITSVPVFELKNQPILDAALLSSKTMQKKAEELFK